MTQQNEQSGFLSMMLSLVGFIRKYYIILIIGVLAGIGMGLKSYFQSKEVAVAKLVISTSVIDNDIVSKLVNSLQLYIETGNRQGLADKMGTTPEKLQTLTGFFADTTKAKMNAIKVDLGLTKVEEADTVSKVLVHYLNSIDFIKNIIDLKAKQREQIIEANGAKIKQIDSLLNNGKISFNSFNDVAAINDNYLKLITEKQDAEYETTAFSNIRLIEQNVTVIPKRGIKNALIINIVAYFFFGFILSALIELIRLYLRKEKEKKAAKV